ncbi:MAG: methyltransferase domain-containing protein [Thiobacillus sp.]|nr:MAG: methyltransferase domain-containing protein [Thiobacillus sp.]
MESAGSRSCPDCYSADVDIVGAIPDAYEFAGRALRSPLAGGSLFRCNTCGLHWRHPQPSKNELNALYRQGAPASWQYHPSKRRDWQIASTIIHTSSNVASVLDVGCFDGRFLDHLGNRYRRAGIEVHPLAAEHAVARGIEIVGRDFSDLDTLHSSFDVVVALDVIEHVSNPRAFLASLAQATRPGGMIIISTGNTAVIPWRLMGGMYWYCNIAEHISFINPHWCEHTARRLELTIESLVTFSHEPARVPESFIQATTNLLYRCMPNLAYGLRRLYAASKGKACRPSDRMPPHWRSAKDHMLIAFRVPIRDSRKSGLHASASPHLIAGA